MLGFELNKRINPVSMADVLTKLTVSSSRIGWLETEKEKQTKYKRRKWEKYGCAREVSYWVVKAFATSSEIFRTPRKYLAPPAARKLNDSAAYNLILDVQHDGPATRVKALTAGLLFVLKGHPHGISPTLSPTQNRGFSLFRWDN